MYLLVDQLSLLISVLMTTPPPRQFGMETLNILIPVPSPTFHTVLLSTSSLASFRERFCWSQQFCMQWLDIAVRKFLGFFVRNSFRFAIDSGNTIGGGREQLRVQWLNIAVWMFLSALLVRICFRFAVDTLFGVFFVRISFRFAIDPGNTMFGGGWEQLRVQWLNIAVWKFLSALLVRISFTCRFAIDTMFGGRRELCVQWLNIAVWMFLSALLVRISPRFVADTGNTMFGGGRELRVQWLNIRIRLACKNCTRDRSSFHGFDRVNWWRKLFVEGLHIWIGGCGWGFSLLESSVVASNVRVVMGPTSTSFCTQVVSNLYIVAWSFVTRGAWLDRGWVLDLSWELWNEHRGAVRRRGLWGLKQCQNNYCMAIYKAPCTPTFEWKFLHRPICFKNTTTRKPQYNCNFKDNNWMGVISRQYLSFFYSMQLG